MPDFVVNTSVAGDQLAPAVAVLANGNLVEVWQSADGGDGSGTLIRGRIFTSADIAADFVINSTTAGDQTVPTVAGLADGGFIVTWTSADGGDGSGTLIRGRLFDANGTPQANDFIVNSTTETDQSSPAVVQLADGNILVTWKSNDGVGSSNTGVPFREQNSRTHV